jgi:ABC-type transport system involved in Fe-S cluster assembly fused permease/ATPase subunit
MLLTIYHTTWHYTAATNMTTSDLAYNTTELNLILNYNTLHIFCTENETAQLVQNTSIPKFCCHTYLTWILAYELKLLYYHH